MATSSLFGPLPSIHFCSFSDLGEVLASDLCMLGAEKASLVFLQRCTSMISCGIKKHSDGRTGTSFSASRTLRRVAMYACF